MGFLKPLRVYYSTHRLWEISSYVNALSAIASCGTISEFYCNNKLDSSFKNRMVPDYIKIV